VITATPRDVVRRKGWEARRVRSQWRRTTTTTIALLSLSTAVACSASHHASTLAPAAEPSTAPPPTTAPAGHVISLPPDRAAEGVAADPRSGLVVVALHHPDAIALVDPATSRVRLRAVAGGARHLVLVRPGGPVLLPAEDTNSLLQISLPSGRVTATTALPRQPHNAAVVDGNYWVADELAASLSVVSPAGRVLATLSGPVQPGGVVTAAGQVGAIDVRGARMYFYDASTFAAEGSIAVGTGPTHAVPIGATDAVVADTRGGALILVNLATRTVVSRVALPGGPYGLAVDPSTSRVWVTLTKTNRVVRVGLRDGALTVLASAPTVQQPNTASFDPVTDCLFVAGVTGSRLEQVCHANDPKLLGLRKP
jgi:hypothetical protein